MNMLHLQLGAKIKRLLEEIDAEVQRLHAEGYGIDADRLLDERIDLARAREDLNRKLMS
jgi:RNA polymerase-binding transcription factor DksA